MGSRHLRPLRLWGQETGAPDGYPGQLVGDESTGRSLNDQDTTLGHRREGDDKDSRFTEARVVSQSLPRPETLRDVRSRPNLSASCLLLNGVESGLVSPKSSL